MKNFTKGVLVMAVTLVVLPLASMLFNAVFPKPIPENAVSVSNTAILGLKSVKILDFLTDTPYEIPLDEYLTQAVLATTEPSCEAELLKAQAVLMRTYILNRRLCELEEKTAELSGCDISTESGKYSKLLSDTEGKILYGEEYEAFKEKVQKAVADTKGECLFYNGEPCVVAFCKACGGATESAKEVLGQEIEYLKSTPCPDTFSQEISLTQDEVFARISLNCVATLSGEPKNWVRLQSVVLPSGFVKEVALGEGYLTSGERLAYWLNLPSAKFSVKYSREAQKFIFTVYGSGHLVGLCHEGACILARNGNTYQEIIEYYMQGAEIVKNPD